MSGGGYLFAKTLIEVPAMLLLSVMALSAGIYGIGNFHGASYVLHVLLYTAVMWSLECMAQLFAVQFDNPLTYVRPSCPPAPLRLHLFFIFPRKLTAAASPPFTCFS